MRITLCLTFIMMSFKSRATPITTPICVGVAMGVTKNPPFFKSLDPALMAMDVRNIQLTFKPAN